MRYAAAALVAFAGIVVWKAVHPGMVNSDVHTPTPMHGAIGTWGYLPKDRLGPTMERDGLWWYA